jgi:hypothetical protein
MAAILVERLRLGQSGIEIESTTATGDEVSTGASRPGLQYQSHLPIKVARETAPGTTLARRSVTTGNLPGIRHPAR